MPRYAVRYLAAPAAGGPGAAVAEAVIEAASPQAVAAALRVRPVDVLTLRALDAAPAVASLRPAALRGARRTPFPLRLFCQELSVLLDSGLPLLEAVQTLREKESAPSVAAVLDSVMAALEQGQTFAQALRAQPQAFGTLFVATIEASQRTGQIPDALRRQAAYLAWLGALRDKLVSASIYPAILIAASLLVLGFLTVFVVPRFAQVYADTGGELPLASRVLLAVGQGVAGHPVIAVGVMGALAVLTTAAARSPAMRARAKALLWRLPKVGERLRLMELAALYRTLGLLLQAGVPVVAALEASRELVGSGLRPALLAATQAVREGVRLSDALQRHGLVTPVSLRMLRVGERSGELGPMLERAAAFYDEELTRFTDWIGKVVNPVLMMVMGLVIGGVVVVMYLPMFQVLDQIQ